MADCPIDREGGKKVSMAEVRGFYPIHDGIMMESADDCDQDDFVIRAINTIVIITTEHYNNE